MKLKDFLDKANINQLVTVAIYYQNMIFETTHDVEFFLNHKDNLKDREILRIYTKDDALCVKLDD